ncbi:MAG: CRISPR system precrRNA processing endoribonuclease RAMP protein Cas6 [bacterium]|nr:MAG: CRISPR system precrRNA processing endoribonuclease RAMP protein Cas6 [bacterium]
MLSFLSRISLIRYLIVWRVNSSLAFFPRYLSVDLSRVIGSIISQRLPSSEKTVWKKALDPLIANYCDTSKNRKEKSESIADVSWPINAVLFIYPGKRTYGRDELIFWELKLFGRHADHGLFLEVILPAMEEASYTSDPQWTQRNRLWGHFDIQSVYAARGNQWEPIVTDGRLDLRYRANPLQWQKKLQFKPKSLYHFRRLNWMSPFDLVDVLSSINKIGFGIENQTLFFNKAPTLTLILLSLIFRVNELLREKPKKLDKIGDLLDDEDRVAFQHALEKVANISITKTSIKPAPSAMPGKWIGTQRFGSIPRSIIPYLELASILHIGKLTHFGCGTFVIA